MIKGLLRGEFPVFGLIEDICIFGILWRELQFHLLCRLCQGSREREPSGMGMAFPEYLSEGGCIPLLGIYSSGVFRFILLYCSEVL